MTEPKPTQASFSLTIGDYTTFRAESVPGAMAPKLVIKGDGVYGSICFHNELDAKTRLAKAKSLRNNAEMLVAMCESHVREPLNATCPKCSRPLAVPGDDSYRGDGSHFCDAIGCLADRDGDAL